MKVLIRFYPEYWTVYLNDGLVQDFDRVPIETILRMLGKHEWSSVEAADLVFELWHRSRPELLARKRFWNEWEVLDESQAAKTENQRETSGLCRQPTA